ncbi:hypothetical protein [Micromonospora sp. 4G55]|uniref:hypothetical protein n=1 Tax=Micromonospora sp. 4G55 TaxID=2806102 RepID=UPI001A4C7508|nr:hypothetical protein [Micromonospora sp. 4G55]MBM0260253.1 hypothetical protein [Micromonospora sp. 4G55]
MLENEPEGGERTGAQPAGQTADATDSTSAEGAATDSAAEAAPKRRRTTRRKAAPLNQPEQVEAPAEASAAAPVRHRRGAPGRGAGPGRR